jgi:hypothetical protein
MGVAARPASLDCGPSDAPSLCGWEKASLAFFSQSSVLSAQTSASGEARETMQGGQAVPPNCSRKPAQMLAAPHKRYGKRRRNSRFRLIFMQD